MTDVFKYIESCYSWDEDLKQDLIVKILELPEDYEINKGWCVRAYNNMLQNRARDNARRRELLQHNEDTVRGNFYDDNQAADPSEVLSAIEEMDDRMDQLSPLVKKTMIMHYVDGLTVEDIAGKEWVEPKAIYERLRVGRNTLKGESNE